VKTNKSRSWIRSHSHKKELRIRTSGATLMETRSAVAGTLPTTKKTVQQKQDFKSIQSCTIKNPKTKSKSALKS